jgi:hypothetical protein
MKWRESMRSHIGSLLVALAVSGCSAASKNVETVVLPTSHQSIDVVQHRSDVKFADCSTLTVLQTYNGSGQLIDSKEARGSALHCVVIPALIEAGGDVGAGYVGRAVNVLSNAQSQGQSQGQAQRQRSSSSSNTNTNSNTNTAVGGAGGAGGSGGGHGHGNNGGGNGDDDGTNPGTGHHHDNGDNS